MRKGGMTDRVPCFHLLQVTNVINLPALLAQVRTGDMH